MNTWDAKVNRVDQPSVGLLTLTVHADGKTEALVVSTLPGALEAGSAL